MRSFSVESRSLLHESGKYHFLLSGYLSNFAPHIHSLSAASGAGLEAAFCGVPRTRRQERPMGVGYNDVLVLTPSPVSAPTGQMQPHAATAVHHAEAAVLPPPRSLLQQCTTRRRQCSLYSFTTPTPPRPLLLDDSGRTSLRLSAGPAAHGPGSIRPRVPGFPLAALEAEDTQMLLIYVSDKLDVCGTLVDSCVLLRARAIVESAMSMSSRVNLIAAMSMSSRVNLIAASMYNS